jgi:hypothetical protein
MTDRRISPADVSTASTELAEMLGQRIAPIVNPNPLQRPGRDTLLRRTSIGGLEQPADRWFIADAKTLERLLLLARSSPTGQARIPRCGVQVDLCRRRDGSTYEVWRIIGGEPEPEPLPPGLAGLNVGVGADKR